MVAIELLPGRITGCDALGLPRAQLHPADLARDGLRQLGDELDDAHPQVRRQALTGEREDLGRGIPLGIRAGRRLDAQAYLRLRHGEPGRVRARHDRGLDDELVLEQHRFELERRDLVVGRLEDVVGATDVGEIAVVVP